MGEAGSKPKPKKWTKQDNFIIRNMNYANWMGEMKHMISNTRLVDLKLIRSHQSASYCIDNFFDKVSICQDASIYYQLYGGVRVIDLRPGLYDDSNIISCGHGPHKAIEIYKILNKIKEFLLNHSKEFIIIEFESAGKFFGKDFSLDDKSKFDLKKTLYEIFGNWMICKEDSFFDFSKTTMEDIWTNNKRLLIISHSFIKSDDDSHDNFIWDMFTYQYGRYANTDCRLIMKNHVNTFVEMSQNKNSASYNQLVSINMQLTPQGIKSVFELNSTLHIDQYLSNWFNTLVEQNKRLNIIAFDFCFFNPQFIRDIIFSNIKTKDSFCVLSKSKHSAYETSKFQDSESCNCFSREKNSQIYIKFLELHYLGNKLISDGDIFKLKFMDPNFEYIDEDSSSHYNFKFLTNYLDSLSLCNKEMNEIGYLTVDKFNNLFLSKGKETKIKKVKTQYFEITIVNCQENIVKLKNCYLSSKEDSQNNNLIFKDLFLKVYKNNNEHLLDEKIYFLNFDEEGSLFKLNFLNLPYLCIITLEDFKIGFPTGLSTSPINHRNNENKNSNYDPMNGLQIKEIKHASNSSNLSLAFVCNNMKSLPVIYLEK
jgi:hypothetical protein